MEPVEFLVKSALRKSALLEDIGSAISHVPWLGKALGLEHSNRWMGLHGQTTEPFDVPFAREHLRHFQDPNPSESSTYPKRLKYIDVNYNKTDPSHAHTELQARRSPWGDPAMTIGQSEHPYVSKSGPYAHTPWEDLPQVVRTMAMKSPSEPKQTYSFGVRRGEAPAAMDKMLQLRQKHLGRLRTAGAVGLGGASALGLGLYLALRNRKKKQEPAEEA